jgi:hypothetical protein
MSRSYTSSPPCASMACSRTALPYLYLYFTWTMRHKNLIQIPFKSASQAILRCVQCVCSQLRRSFATHHKVWHLFWAFRWSNVLFDDEYLLFGTVDRHFFWYLQNRTKTNDKQMAWVLQCVSKVSSNYNHSLRRKLSLNLVRTLWITL